MSNEDFLNFNGKNIVYINQDGEYFIAIKPICEALGIDYTAQFKTLKNHRILGAVLVKTTMQVPNLDVINKPVFQGREMIALPERYVYGWVFSLSSNSPTLIEYQQSCYDLLYQHFHGIITGRKRLLFQRLELEERLDEKKKTAKAQSPIFEEIEELLERRRKINKQLAQLDKKVVNQEEIKF